MGDVKNHGIARIGHSWVNHWPSLINQLEFPEGSLVSGERFIYKADVESVRARPVCGGFFTF